ncbi:MAG: hypothetical protein RJB39_734 [Candidatus Parcubacteria bacterium]|jgi:SAM-dependent methyltransferase
MTIDYKEVVAVADRKPLQESRMILLPNISRHLFGSPEGMEEMATQAWMSSFTVHKKDAERAKELAIELQTAFQADPDGSDVIAIITNLQALRLKSMHEYHADDIWRKGAFALTNYTGPPLVKQVIVRRLDRYDGDILEAMCGHTTHIAPSGNKKVVALDGCEASLERYPFPFRPRILCDLDQINEPGKELPFSTGYFDAISICFGFKYPEHLDLLLREFHRILKRGGKMSFIENPESEYPQLIHRRFCPITSGDLLQAAGFSGVSTEAIVGYGTTVWNPIYRGHFFHLEGTA